MPLNMTPYKILAGVLLAIMVVVASLATGNHYGRLAVQAKWDKEKLEVAREVASIRERQVVVTQVTETQVIERVRVVREQGATIIKEVPIYVPSDTPDLPAGWRLLHDAAALGTALPGPAAIAAGAPVSAQDAASTVAENYATCREYAVKVQAWQEWAKQQAAATRTRAPASTDMAPVVP